MLKTLANCKPSEFLAQTNKIRKAAFRWITDTNIGSIRKRLPALKPFPVGATEEEKAAIVRENRDAMRAQSMVNLNAILDAVMEQHADETLELLALVCFIDPKDADNHEMREYFSAISELISDESVISFFTSLASLDLTDTSATAKE